MSARSSNLKVALFAAGVALFLSPIKAAAEPTPAQTTDVGPCGPSPCPPSSSDYADRMRVAWQSSATTQVQRSKIKELVAAHTQNGVIDWTAAATAYFGWRAGAAYVLTQPAPPKRVEPSWTKMRQMVEASVRSQLVDPDSAKFKWPYGFMQGVWRTPKKYEGLITCGIVNARNRMGGFAGDSMFAAVINGGQIAYLDVDGSDSGLNSYLCGKAASRFPPPQDG